MTLYWIVINITPHKKHPVTYPGIVSIKSYFDEKPHEYGDMISENNTPKGMKNEYMVPSEHSEIYRGTSIYHQISRDEFMTPKYEYYLWAEPYGSIALSHKISSEGFSIGRLKLTAAHQKLSGKASSLKYIPPGIKKDDMIIEFDIEISNSVCQYMADEMNKNIHSSQMQSVKRLIQASKTASTKEKTPSDYMLEDMIKRETGRSLDDFYLGEAKYQFGRSVHAAHHPEHTTWNTVTTAAQYVYFLGGGEFDHKPKIYETWGGRNRLGNRGYVYRYDVWSNMHYGFIGAHVGFSLQELLEGADVAQKADQGAQQDDLVDKQAITEGYNLYGRKNIDPITIIDIVTIFERNPDWIKWTHLEWVKSYMERNRGSMPYIPDEYVFEQSTQQKSELIKQIKDYLSE